MSTLTLGIDVSKEKLDVALYDGQGYQVGTFDNSRQGHKKLHSWLKKRAPAGIRVCLEATGRYGEAVAEMMHEQGYAVSVVNPAQIKAYGESQLKRNKTDREDAKVIAHYGATQTPSLWQPLSSTQRELQDLARRLEALKADRTRELNRRQAGLTSAVVLEGIDAHIAFLDQQMAAIKKRIKQLVDDDPQLRQQRDLLTSIPGIGDTTASHFMAEVPDITRFTSAGQLAAYVGLTPKQHRSGSSIHKPGRLVKTGNGRLRTALYMPAMNARRFNPITRALAERLEKAGKTPMTIIGAVMRKLIHLAFGVLKHRQPFDPNYLVNVQDSA